MSMTEPAAEAADTPEGSNALSWPTADDIGAEEAETSEPEATEPEAADEPTEETTEEAPTEETTEEPPAVETFDRPYVEKLREEAAEYRVRAKEFNEAFEGYDDDTRAKFLDMARGLNDESRHVEVANEFVAIGKRVLEAYGVDVSNLGEVDPNRPLTLKELEAREAKQAEDRAAQESIARIAKEVEELGYAAGSPDHYALLRVAHDDPDGDLKKAHERLQASTVEKAKALLASDDGAELRKGVIEEFIKAVKEKQATHLPTTPATGVAPADPGDEPVTDFSQTRERMDQWLADREA